MGECGCRKGKVPVECSRKMLVFVEPPMTGLYIRENVLGKNEDE
jgi:hypothetical protein